MRVAYTRLRKQNRNESRGFLHTNVPLDETIGICADALYRGHLDCPPFPEDIFEELMLIATRGVEFSFNNQIYKQLDGLAMGSPFGPALANIFVGFHESRLFDSTVKPGVYFRYVDDTFVIFGSELDCDCFHEKLNLLNPVLKVIVENEQNNSLNFLDVLVEKEGIGFLTYVYRKPTFTGQYIRWNSFSSKAIKISLDTLLIISRVSAYVYIFRFTFRSLSNVSYSDEWRTKASFSV